MLKESFEERNQRNVMGRVMGRAFLGGIMKHASALAALGPGGFRIYDVANIGTHEAGHVYGLGHPSSARFETMYAYGYSGETLKRSPASGRSSSRSRTSTGRSRSCWSCSTTS